VSARIGKSWFVMRRIGVNDHAKWAGSASGTTLQSGTIASSDNLDSNLRLAIEALWNHHLTVEGDQTSMWAPFDWFRLGDHRMQTLIRMIEDIIHSPSLQAAALAEAGCWEEMIRLFE
jgi:hypothetical protein